MRRHRFPFTPRERENLIFMLNDYAELLEFALGIDETIDASTLKRQQDARALAKLIEMDAPNPVHC